MAINVCIYMKCRVSYNPYTVTRYIFERTIRVLYDVSRTHVSSMTIIILLIRVIIAVTALWEDREWIAKAARTNRGDIPLNMYSVWRVLPFDFVNAYILYMIVGDCNEPPLYNFIYNYIIKLWSQFTE